MNTSKHSSKSEHLSLWRNIEERTHWKALYKRSILMYATETGADTKTAKQKINIIEMKELKINVSLSGRDRNKNIRVQREIKNISPFMKTRQKQ